MFTVFCLRCLALAGPWTAGEPGGRAVQTASIEKVIGHMPHGGDLARCSRLQDKPPFGPTALWVAWARSSRLHASSETNVSADSSFVGLVAAVLLYLSVAATSQDFALAFAAAATGSDSVFFGLQRMI